MRRKRVGGKRKVVQCLVPYGERVAVGCLVFVEVSKHVGTVSQDGWVDGWMDAKGCRWVEDARWAGLLGCCGVVGRRR